MSELFSDVSCPTIGHCFKLVDIGAKSGKEREALDNWFSSTTKEGSVVDFILIVQRNLMALAQSLTVLTTGGKGAWRSVR